MPTPKISKVEWATFVGQRPREAGCNARLSVHGLNVPVPLARLTTDDGTIGFGPCRTTPPQAQALLGQPIDALISASGVQPEAEVFEYPLWDLLGQQVNQPIYQIVAQAQGKSITAPFRVRCYDTSLYIDDLHLPSHQAAADLIASEAQYGYDHNHRAFKIKVGRGARHMGLIEGTERDIAVIKAVRQAVGPEPAIMIDANNGYNLNLTKQVLAETADCDLFWLEEAFHEDKVLYEDLRQWLDKEGLAIKIADGEGQASPTLMAWAKEGILDVVQYDIFGYGFTNWLETGKLLDEWGRLSAPHHYGRHVGNYLSGHLAAGINGFTFVEWDEVTTPGLDASAYTIDEGQVVIPNLPGFGLTLDDDLFQQAVGEVGFVVQL